MHPQSALWVISEAIGAPRTSQFTSDGRNERISSVRHSRHPRIPTSEHALFDRLLQLPRELVGHLLLAAMPEPQIRRFLVVGATRRRHDLI